MTGPAAGAGRPLLVVVGAGARAYREYAFVSVAARFRIWLLADRAPTWELPYLTGHTVLDTTDPAALLGRARAPAPAGVLTWDDTRVVQVATLAAALGLPGAGPRAALSCRDKHLTRTALAVAGVPQARSELVGSLAEARAAAERVGFPLVLKPRALNASIGVVRVDSADQLAGRFRVARGAELPAGVRGADVAPGGVLVEEYLDGPEISVDAAWVDGAMVPAFTARKRTGWPPYFEELGHSVDAADPLQADPTVTAVVAAAHRAIGFGTGWTHTELRLTATGPRVVEVNARLGGDLIPYLGLLALGIDSPLGAAVAATGGRPDPTPDSAPASAPGRGRAAAVRFLYPQRAGIVRAVGVEDAMLPAGISSVEVVAVPGQELTLPPDGHVTGRYAVLVATGPDAAACAADLDAATTAVHVDLLSPARLARR